MKIADRYSPIQSKYFFGSYNKSADSTLEGRLFTFEDGLWNVRGRYEKAYEDDEELVWSDVRGESVAHILIVSTFFPLLFSFSHWFGVRTPLEKSPSLNLVSLLPLLNLLMCFLCHLPMIVT
jgi:hypothetical protein